MSGRTVRGLLAALFVLSAGCTEPEPNIQYAAYAGPTAYPDRRPKLPSGSFAMVANRGSDSISVLAAGTLEVVMDVPIGRDPITVDAPVGLAVDATGTVYTALAFPFPSPLPGPHAKHSPTERWGFVQKLAADDLRVLGEAQVPPNAAQMALGGGRMVITHFELARAFDAKLSADEQKSTLSVIDAATMVARSMSVCRAPNGVAFGSDPQLAFVACQADDAIAVVDTQSLGTPRAMVPAGCKAPSRLEASPSGKVLSVSCAEPKQTRVFDVVTQTMRDQDLVTEGMPGSPAWSPDETRLFVPTQTPDALVLFDVATGAVVRQRAFDATNCLRPRTAVTRGATLYLVCEGDHVGPGRVLALDSTTLETTATRAVGVYPDRLTFGGPP